jgi:choline dehydrogenase-like flavoprotein
MTAEKHYDVIIIGTGAGGGTLAYKLAPSGKRILLLERGDYVPRERENWSTKAVNLEAKYNTREAWYDKAGRALHPHTNYYVGGNTKFYGAALFRLRAEDFGEIRHAGGISPAWPVPTTNLSLITCRPSACIRCMVNAAKIRPNRWRAGHMLILRSVMKRVSSNSAKILLAPDCAPFIRHWASC